MKGRYHRDTECREETIFRFKLEILQGNGYVEYFRGTEIFGGWGFRVLCPNKPLFSKPKKGHTNIQQFVLQFRWRDFCLTGKKKEKKRKKKGKKKEGK